MIDGFSGFNNFKKILDTAPENSPTVEETVVQWEKFQTGDEISQPG